MEKKENNQIKMENLNKPIPIIVIAYNQVKYTKQCIDSIYECTKVPFKLIFVNNGSTDDTDKWADEFKLKNDNFVYLKNEKNLGFAGGNNAGFKYALENLDFDYLMILNNDAIVTPNYMERMLYCLNNSGRAIRKSNVGVVGPVCNYIGGRQAIKIPELKSKSDIYKFGDAWYNSNKGSCFESGMMVGFCYLIKREVLEKVGLFDDLFGKGMFEDNDWVLRARREGYLFVCARDVFIFHYGSKTLKDDKEISPIDLFNQNRQLFIKKWKEVNNIGFPKVLVGVCRVKNGEKYLKEVLDAITKMCNKVFILDDNSTDKTPDICKSYSNVVYEKSKYTDLNEARDRNYIINKGKELGAEWIWGFDADECPENKLVNDIQKLLNNPNPETKLYIFKICHFWDSKDFIRTDGLWGGFYQGRLFKVEKNQELVADDKDGLHVGSHPSYPIENTSFTIYRIKHYGNMEKEERMGKYENYTKNDKNKNINSILGGYAEYYKNIYGYAPKDKLQDKDYYRHIIDNTNLSLQTWEDNLELCCFFIIDNSNIDINALAMMRSRFEKAYLILDKRVYRNLGFNNIKFNGVFVTDTLSKDFNYFLKQKMNKFDCKWYLFLRNNEMLNTGNNMVNLYGLLDYTDVDAFTFLKQYNINDKLFYNEEVRLFNKNSKMEYINFDINYFTKNLSKVNMDKAKLIIMGE